MVHPYHGTLCNYTIQWNFFAVTICANLKGLLQSNVYVMLYLTCKVQSVYIFLCGDWWELADRRWVRGNFSMYNFFSNYVNVLPIQKTNWNLTQTWNSKRLECTFVFLSFKTQWSSRILAVCGVGVLPAPRLGSESPEDRDSPSSLSLSARQ